MPRPTMHLDPAAFRDVFLAERDRLHRFLWRLCGNAADADDLLQESFLAAWRKRGQYAGRGSVEGWLRRIAYHTYLNAHAKRARREELAPPAESAAVCEAVEDGAADREVLRLVAERALNLVATLPDGPREAFVMFRLEGLPIAEIASITGVPAKTVETRVRRAVHLLHEALHPWKAQLPAR